MRVSVFLLILAVLGGCASTEETCQIGNWTKLGNEQALDGEGREEGINYWNNKCSEYGVSVNKAKYNLGYKSGLTTYCSRDFAYKKGTRGYSLNADLCSENAQGKARKANQDGKMVYRLNKQINSLSSDYNSLIDQLKYAKTMSEINEIKREKTRIDREKRQIERERDRISVGYDG